MEMSLPQVIIIPLLTALTALMAHQAMAVFHDGIRPILPELVEGRMKRSEAASVAFGLSVGFIASVGIAFTLSTSLLNPWLLFLPTDILGVMATRRHWAALFGLGWGGLIVTSLSAVNAVLTGLPVDFISALGELSGPVVSGFALFPLVAIFYQFGWQKGLGATGITLLVRLLTVKYTKIFPESIEIFIGMLCLIVFAIYQDYGKRGEAASEEESIFEERTKRIQKNLPYLAVAGGLIAAACNLRIFAGSEVSIYVLAKAYAAGDAATTQQLLQQAAIGDFMRGLGFVPLIATTALATGVYGVVGLTFIYPIGYLAPHWTIAALGGMIVVTLEVLLLRGIGKQLQTFPSIREASDNIRSAITTVMELALLVGSIFAVIKMGGYTGFFIGAMVCLANDAMGKPIISLAIGPVAAIVTGILLNVAYWLQLFVPLAAK